MLNIRVNGAQAFIQYIVGLYDTNNEFISLYYSYFSRSEIAVKSVGANLSLRTAELYDNKKKICILSKVEESDSYTTKMVVGKEIFTHGILMSKEIGKKFIITSEDNYLLDGYSFLMNKFDLPLLEEWMPFLMGCEEIAVRRKHKMYGEFEGNSDLIIYEMTVNQKSLEAVVSNAIKEKRIRVCEKEQQRLNFSNMDDYFATYGSSIIKNLKEKLTPRVPDSCIMEDAAFFQKRLFPQQANVVNGVVESLFYKKYCIMNEGMGTGKTLQSLAVIEGFVNKRYINAHKGVSIKDIYENNLTLYRNILMVPAHLVVKWADYIREEVPYANVKIIRCLKDLITLREEGIKPKQKDYYIISKDTSKLSYSVYPLPTQIKIKEVKEYCCKECHTTRPYLADTCKCGSEVWEWKSMNYMDKGLICPECGELLYPTNIKYLKLNRDSSDKTNPLLPSDFNAHTTANMECRYCHAPLWAPDCNPIGKSKRKRKWKKVSHYINMAKKGRRTSWILNDDIRHIRIQEDISEVAEQGNRKYSLALFIRKYLKGYFDFAIFDEAHKCESSKLTNTINIAIC